jgi:cytochrome oxidase Cu insertion factor (SCO1/SenC/PrrC family)
MQRPRLLLAFLIFALIIIAGAAYFYLFRGAGTAPNPPATQTGQALIGGPFALTDQNGQRVTDGQFRGRFMLVYFGYTHCPDVCPLGLETITQALSEVPAASAQRVQPIFITLDPERDTAAVLKDYITSFDPRLVALTGSPAEIEAVLKAYRVYSRKADAQAGGEYLMDHSTFTYVMGPDGGYATHFSHGTTPEEMAKSLTALVAETPATS